MAKGTIRALILFCSTLVLGLHNKTWEELPSLPWEGRFGDFCITARNEPVERSYVIGGSDSFRILLPGVPDSANLDDVTLYRDVWSSIDVSSWERVLDDAPWGGRIGYSLTACKSHIMLIGGYSKEQLFPSSAYSSFYSVYFHRDIWLTPDGKSWEQVCEEAPFVPRVGSRVFQFNDVYWMFGGVNINGEVTNEIWSANYADCNWIRIIPQDPKEDVFSPRAYPGIVTGSDGRLWLLGGIGNLLEDPLQSASAGGVANFGARTKPVREWNAALLSDLWSSSNGRIWRRVFPISFPTPRLLPTLFSFHGVLWVTSGFVFNELPDDDEEEEQEVDDDDGGDGTNDDEKLRLFAGPKKTSRLRYVSTASEIASDLGSNANDGEGDDDSHDDDSEDDDNDPEPYVLVRLMDTWRSGSSMALWGIVDPGASSLSVTALAATALDWHSSDTSHETMQYSVEDMVYPPLGSCYLCRKHAIFTLGGAQDLDEFAPSAANKFLEDPSGNMSNSMTAIPSTEMPLYEASSRVFQMLSNILCQEQGIVCSGRGTCVRDSSLDSRTIFKNIEEGFTRWDLEAIATTELYSTAEALTHAELGVQATPLDPLPVECTCDAKYTGIRCEQLACSEETCIHGKCEPVLVYGLTEDSVVEKCICFQPYVWSGPECNTPVCALHCHPQSGHCTGAPGTCFCRDGWTGFDCAILNTTPQKLGRWMELHLIPLILAGGGGAVLLAVLFVMQVNYMVAIPPGAMDRHEESISYHKGSSFPSHASGGSASGAYPLLREGNVLVDAGASHGAVVIGGDGSSGADGDRYALSRDASTQDSWGNRIRTIFSKLSLLRPRNGGASSNPETASFRASGAFIGYKSYGTSSSSSETKRLLSSHSSNSSSASYNANYSTNINAPYTAPFPDALHMPMPIVASLSGPGEGIEGVHAGSPVANSSSTESSAAFPRKKRVTFSNVVHYEPKPTSSLLENAYDREELDLQGLPGFREQDETEPRLLVETDSVSKSFDKDALPPLKIHSPSSSRTCPRPTYSPTPTKKVAQNYEPGLNQDLGHPTQDSHMHSAPMPSFSPRNSTGGSGSRSCSQSAVPAADAFAESSTISTAAVTHSPMAAGKLPIAAKFPIPTIGTLPGSAPGMVLGMIPGMVPGMIPAKLPTSPYGPASPYSNLSRYRMGNPLRDVHSKASPKAILSPTGLQFENAGTSTPNQGVRANAYMQPNPISFGQPPQSPSSCDRSEQTKE